MTLLNGCMHGVNFMLLSRLPRSLHRMAECPSYPGFSTPSPMLGGGLAAFLIGAVAERFGWLVVAGMWGGVALAGTLLCTAGIRRFSAFLQRTAVMRKCIGLPEAKRLSAAEKSKTKAEPGRHACRAPLIGDMLRKS